MRSLLTACLFFVFLANASSQCNTTVLSTTNATCNGLCNGTSVLFSTGGTPPYTATGPFTGSPVSYSSAGTLTGFCAGVHTVTIVDAMGCINTVVITVSQPPSITISSSSTNESSSGACDGSITMSATGGTGSFTYSIDNGVTYQSSSSFPNLCSGGYSVCVKDANGCVECDSAWVGSSGCTFVSTIGVINNASCYGSCDGVIAVTSSGGTMPYYITVGSIGPILYTSGTTISGLCAGTYLAYTYDNAGCSHTVPFTITQPASINLSVTGNSESSSGACDGSITATASGGVTPYTYTINGSTVSPPFDNLCEGYYEFCVVDANGCSNCDSVYVGTSSCTITASVMSSTNISCYGECDGSITLTATGGTMPYTVIHPMTGAPIMFTSSITLNGFCAGVYTFLVTDAVGCDDYLIHTFSQPTQLTITTTSNPQSSAGACDGLITISATGGVPGYQYSLDGGITWQAGNTFNSLCSGSYTACVMDANGCVTCTGAGVSTAGCSMTTSLLSTNHVDCHGDCDGGGVVMTTGGTPPYTITVDGNTFTYTSVGTFTGLCAGTYTAVIEDAGSCVNTVVVTINEPSQLNAIASVLSNTSFPGACDGSTNSSVSGGTSPYTYNWVACPGMTGSFGTSSTATGLCAGSYAVIVTDNNGCTDTSGCVTVQNPTGIVESTHKESFNVFPNPTSGIITIECGENMQGYITLMDVTGNVVAAFEMKEAHKTIDLNQLQLENGVYFVSMMNAEGNAFGRKFILAR